MENNIRGGIMRKAILVALVAIGLVLGICVSGLAGASTQYTASVLPKVNVESGGSLSIVSGTVSDNHIDFENVAPGSATSRTLILGVSANDSWALTVGKNQDLNCAGIGESIPSTNFTYTSNGSGEYNYQSSDTQFGGSGNPSNVVTGGTAVGGCNVNVVYKLVVPAEQRTGFYTALHTYTLIVGN
jgi:hypothetical protein